MQATRSLRAIVIGGGIGGLSSAIALRQAGVDAVVYERGTDLQRVSGGGGIHLWTNAMRAFQRLGLAEDVQAIGSRVERAEFRTWENRLLAAWPVGDMGRALGAPTVGVSRADPHPVLTRALPPSALHLGAKCAGFTQDESGVTVRFADGREERGDLLIGADGIRSTIRAQILGASEPRPARYSLWQAITDFEHERLPVGVFRVFWGPGSRFAYYHIGGERLYWFCVLNTSPGAREPRTVSKAALLGHFQAWPEPIGAIIESTGDAAINRTEMHDRKPVRRWGEARTTLLGDAAHPMTFNVGQGACQAIEDAVVLARQVRRQQDIARALRDYEARRTRRTAPIVRLAWRLAVMGRWESRAACALRDRLMQVMLGGLALKGHARDMAFEF